MPICQAAQQSSLISETASLTRDFAMLDRLVCKRTHQLDHWRNEGDGEDSTPSALREEHQVRDSDDNSNRLNDGDRTSLSWSSPLTMTDTRQPTHNITCCITKPYQLTLERAGHYNHSSVAAAITSLSVTRVPRRSG